jgi:exosortase H (IPTLxxWG-CTERM-specific)
VPSKARHNEKLPPQKTLRLLRWHNLRLRVMIRFLALFLFLVTALFAAELTAPVQKFLVVPWTSVLAQASAALLTLFDPQVIAYGKILQNGASGFAISIEAGCNGVEAALILIAAMLAFPAPWKHRLLGILAGLIAIQALNLVRVVSLFYLGQWNQAAFEWAHLYLWQILIMFDALIVWLIWMRLLPVRAADASATT